MLALILFVTWRTLDGPFSAVSRPTIARLDAFFSIFQNLHVVRSFAPLETQFFAKKNRLFFLQILLFIAVKPDFMTNFLTNFDEILTNFDEILTNGDEFWRTLTNFDEFWRILLWRFVKSSSKIWRMNSSFVIFEWRTGIRHHHRPLRKRAPPLVGGLVFD